MRKSIIWLMTFTFLLLSSNTITSARAIRKKSATTNHCNFQSFLKNDNSSNEPSRIAFLILKNHSQYKSGQATNITATYTTKKKNAFWSVNFDTPENCKSTTQYTAPPKNNDIEIGGEFSNRIMYDHTNNIMRLVTDGAVVAVSQGIDRDCFLGDYLIPNLGTNTASGVRAYTADPSYFNESKKGKVTDNTARATLYNYFRFVGANQVKSFLTKGYDSKGKPIYYCGVPSWATGFGFHSIPIKFNGKPFDGDKSGGCIRIIEDEISKKLWETAWNNGNRGYKIVIY